MRFLRKGDRYALNKPLIKYSDPSLYGFKCLILPLLGKFYYQFSCNVQESRASGATGYFLDRNNREKGVVKERLLRIARSDGRSSAAVLLTIFCVLFSFASIMEAQAQEPRQSGATSQEEVVPLVFGSKVPEDFWTREHLFYVDGDTIRKSLEEYRGKALILDFWFSACGGCIANLKHTERVKNVLDRDLNVLLVNSRSSKDGLDKIAGMYERTVPSKWAGSIPSIIFDEYLTSLFPRRSVPCYVWLSKNGLLKATTVASFVSVGEAEKYLDY